MRRCIGTRVYSMLMNLGLAAKNTKVVVRKLLEAAEKASHCIRFESEDK